MSVKAIFLDKDGTLVQNVPYNVDPEHIALMPGAGEGLRQLHQAGYKLIVVSNQSGIARGYFRETALRGVELKLRELLAGFGVPLAGFYYCPHHPAGMIAPYAIHCNCRKPTPGLLLRAAQERQIDLAGAWMIGDILDDVEAGRRAGCMTILLDNGHETEWQITPLRQPHHRAGDLMQAARLILAQDLSVQVAEATSVF